MQLPTVDVLVVTISRLMKLRCSLFAVEVSGGWCSSSSNVVYLMQLLLTHLCEHQRLCIILPICVFVRQIYYFTSLISLILVGSTPWYQCVFQHSCPDDGCHCGANSDIFFFFKAGHFPCHLAKFSTSNIGW